MLQPDLKHSIRHATEEVLETMFFSTLLDDEGMEASTPLVSSRLGFCGTPSGSFQVDVSTEAAEILAADFLGGEEMESSDPVGQVVCELANILCGSILSRTGSETVFQLSSPVRTVESAGDWSIHESFALPGGSLTVNMQIQEAP